MATRKTKTTNSAANKNATTKKATAKTTAEKTATAKPNAKKKVSQLDAAIAVLKKSRKPMSCKDMVEAMTKQKLWSSPTGKTPDATLYAAILRDLTKGKNARFTKTAPGQFTNNSK